MRRIFYRKLNLKYQFQQTKILLFFFEHVPAIFFNKNGR